MVGHHAHESGGVVAGDVAEFERRGGASGAVGGAHLIVEGYLKGAQLFGKGRHNGILGVAASSLIADVGLAGDG